MPKVPVASAVGPNDSVVVFFAKHCEASMFTVDEGGHRIKFESTITLPHAILGTTRRVQCWSELHLLDEEGQLLKGLVEQRVVGKFEEEVKFMRL